jgi:hypothetical protein
MIPTILFSIDSGFGLRRISGCSRSTTSRQLEALLYQHIKSLLQEGVFEEEPGGVPFWLAVIWISTLVEGLAENVTTQWHPPAD